MKATWSYSDILKRLQAPIKIRKRYPLRVQSECSWPNQNGYKGTPDPKQESDQGGQRLVRVRGSEQGLAGSEDCGWAWEACGGVSEKT